MHLHTAWHMHEWVWLVTDMHAKQGTSFCSYIWSVKNVWGQCHLVMLITNRKVLMVVVL